ncbi:MAG: prolyl oligopeptidase family serine peptidase [Thermotoga caldifontis]|uniref:prolyl oligopeptidase family serine peptidase n=1 Tax=Thermotoga caldifontis TaxID=1508419 RepID=UPI003C79C064
MNLKRGILLLVIFGIFSTLFAQEGMSVRSVTLVTKVFPDVERVFAVVIEYPVEIDRQKLSPNQFAVRAKSGDTYFPRTIKKVYANNTGEVSFSVFRNRGKYVILELDPWDPNAGTFIYGSPNVRAKLDYIVSQIVPILDVDGKEVEPFVSKQTGEKHLIIDDFLAFTFKDAETNVEIPYRLFVPKDVDPEKKYPLVVFLHGGGERGTDNYVQLASNRGAVVWAEPRHQLVHPCFVLAPQCPPNSFWSLDTIRAVVNLIKKLMEEYNIDEKRVYVTGLSMGGAGTWTAIMEFPELFAAAIPICGMGDVNKVERIKDMPIWVFHAEDDPVVPVVNSRILVKKLAEIGGKVRYTEYEKGFVLRYLKQLGWKTDNPGLEDWVPHSSWQPTYDNEEVIEWLFSQSK